MLHIAGTVLEVDKQLRGNPGEQFTQINVRVLTGKSNVEEVRLGRDFQDGPHGLAKFNVPAEGSEVVLEVVVSAFARRAGGAGYSLTALSDVTEKLGALLPA